MMLKQIFPLVLFFVISYAMGQKDQEVMEAYARELMYKVVIKDILTPYSAAYYYKAKKETVGKRDDFFVYENQEYGFLNLWKKEGPEYNEKITLEVDRFLRSLGYLKGKSTL